MTDSVVDNQSLNCNPSLDAFIRDEIATHDGIAFSEYMHHCLYHPQYGYYMHPRMRIGSQGDFFTSSSVHSLFGGLIARQLVQMWDVLGSEAFTIVEQGAGEGHLAVDILDEIAANVPELYQQLRYLVVEVSPDNRQRQANNLRAHVDRVEWCTFEEVSGIQGCFLSNELVDAFAVAIVEKHQSQLHEVFVVEKDGLLCEELRSPVSAKIETHFEALGFAPVEGNRAEVCLAAADWMAAIANKLERGYVLTIDYGYPAAELYAPFRRQGTLLCYCQHTANDNPYQHIGCQDITSHVDFTLLQQSGASAGLQTLYFAEQYRFLIGLGFVEELVRLQAQEEDEKKAWALRMTLKNLIMPDGGMGETFKVLIQGKGVDAPQLLCARSLRDILPEAFAGM
ncbi:MAG: SAM-dependent methyltransferase [Thermodesulfobacteriota bacterium]|nr:SAM-dependent methyltransferase [Thermodesulfobacteriota bacterium]